MKNNALCLLTLTLIALPFISFLPVWIFIVYYSILFVGFFFQYNHQRAPHPLIPLLILITSAVTLYFHFGTLFEYKAGASFLLLLTALRFLDTAPHQKKDGLIIGLLSFYILFSYILNNPSLFSTIFSLTISFLIIINFFQINSDSLISLKETMRSSLRLVILSLPIFLLLYLFFPRFNLNIDKENKFLTSSTGISEILNPELFSKLKISDEIVFRAFSPMKNFPHHTDLYWRGVVLTKPHGLEWLTGDVETIETPIFKNTNQKHHQILMEPTSNSILYGLDYPTHIDIFQSNHKVIHKIGNTFNSSFNIDTHLTYEVFSNETLPIEPKKNLALYLVAPENIHPDIKNLAHRLKDKSSNNEKTIQNILNFFKSFQYSLNLTPPSKDPLYQFLFETKSGFCAHFASAFSIISRLVGIPSRVVLGFHGGNYNSFGKYLMITNREAHAWSEVWLENKNWIRVDPTSVVYTPPFLLTEQSLSYHQNNYTLAQLKKDFIELFDSLTTNWIIFQNEYNQEIQKIIIKNFGITNPWMGLWFIMGMALLFGFILILFHLPRRNQLDEMSKIYQSLISLLEKKGLEISPLDGPLIISQKALQIVPQKSDKIEKIFYLYTQLKYGKEHSFDSVKTLKKMISQFDRRN